MSNLAVFRLCYLRISFCLLSLFLLYLEPLAADNLVAREGKLLCSVSV